MLLLNMVAITLCSMTLVVSGLIALFERDDSDARALGIIMSIVLIVAIVTLTLNISAAL